MYQLKKWEEAAASSRPGVVEIGDLADRRAVDVRGAGGIGANHAGLIGKEHRTYLLN